MTTDSIIEKNRLDQMIRAAMRDKQNAEQRFKAARKAIEAAEKKTAALHVALAAYRAKYGISKTPIMPNSELAAEFSGMDTNHQINHWADIHNGTVIVRDLVDATVAAGFYRDRTQARGTLYRAITRLSYYKHISRGVYKRDNPESWDERLRFEEVLAFKKAPICSE